jgi:hypothetical protein
MKENKAVVPFNSFWRTQQQQQQNVTFLKKAFLLRGSKVCIKKVWK